jgi:hypothetical protein
MAATDDSARHRLFRKFEDVLGPEEAATLMQHLHPSHWDELATKADLGVLRNELSQQLELRLEATEQRVLGAIHHEMAGLVTSQTRTIVFALVAALAANGGLVLAAVRL